MMRMMNMASFPKTCDNVSPAQELAIVFLNEYHDEWLSAIDAYEAGYELGVRTFRALARKGIVHERRGSYGPEFCMKTPTLEDN